jgi:hypothetical protein
MNDELSALLVDEQDVARECLMSSLQGLIQIGKKSGAIIPTPAFERLDRKTRILAFLLGLRAASTLGVTGKDEASVEEIAAVVGFDAKSVGEYTSRLRRTYLSRGPAGYTVPPEKVRVASEHIKSVKNTLQENL